MTEFDVQDYERWLHAVANDLLPPDSPLHDDLVQEGRIAMWRSLERYDPSKGALPSWVTAAARLRMKDFAHGTGRPFGHTPRRGERAVEETSSEALQQGSPGLWDSLEVRDADDSLLERVLVAYHRGEILRAIGALTPEQRRYVVLRFWGGVDPATRSPGVREVAPKVNHRLWGAIADELADELASLREWG